MKIFLLNTFRFIIPIFILLFSVNYFGDAAHLFNRDYERKLADIISKGSHATNVTNYDDRIFQEELINRLKFTPDLVVLGSSRTMLIKGISDFRILNSSVSGASLEDIIAIYQMYKRAHKMPDKIIIGIDPWFFNENNDQNRWESISHFYYDFFNENIKIKNKNHYKQLFSLSYFKDSFENLPNKINGIDEPVPTETMYNFQNTLLRDGSLTYGENYREATELEVKRKAEKYASRNIYSLRDFDSISLQYKNDFEKLIYEIKANNIEVEFFLSPYYPLVFYKIQSDYPAVLQVEEYIINYSNKNGILIYGSFNPIILGRNEMYFYDGMHLKEEGVEFLLSRNKDAN